MTFAEWAQRWGLPPQAIAELSVLSDFGADDGEGSEARLQSLVRLEAARKGLAMWRNNVGVLVDKTGRPIRYGLANDSKQVNAVIKSADLIGIRPVLIKADHVGKILGQFVSRECKRPGWTYTGTEREQAQLRWATLVNSLGGDAAMVNSEGSL